MLGSKEDRPDASVPEDVASAYLGSFVPSAALDHLERFAGLVDIRRTLPALLDEVATLLSEGRIVGWMQGRAEFGPRALGNRSILADPRRADMKDRLNAQVKFREEFRPFAPSILDECGEEYFVNYQSSRYMERTLRFRPEKAKLVPAVVHADRTGPVQSVRRAWNPVFYDLVRDFFERTCTPPLLKTILNVMGSAISHSLEVWFVVFW